MIEMFSNPVAHGIAKRVWGQRHELMKAHIDTRLFTVCVSTDLWYALRIENKPTLAGEWRIFEMSLEHEHTLPDNSVVLRYEVKA